MDQLHARLNQSLLQRLSTSAFVIRGILRWRKLDFFELQYLGHEPRQVVKHLEERIEVARVAYIAQPCGLINLAYALVGVGDRLPGFVIWRASRSTYLKSSLQFLILLVCNRCILSLACCLDQLERLWVCIACLL